VKFKKDIFISYAHIDDEALVEGEPGWISEFHRSLEIRLAQLLGHRPNIWRDKDLDGNHEFSEEILQQLPDIALLVSIHSPRYVKSEWCVREVNEFHRVAQSNIGATIGTKSRIFKVIKTPVDINQHPSVIQGLLGYEFYKMDPDTGKPREFSKLYGKDAQVAYWAKLDDLAHDLADLLEEIANSEKSNASVVAETKKEISSDQASHNTTIALSDALKKMRNIFLAETSADNKENRESLVRFLSGKGFNVLPDKNMPVEADEYCAAVKEMVNQCELCIHMIGSNFGLVLEGTAKSKIQLQAEITAELNKEKGTPRLIWMPPELKITDERQLNFVEDIKMNESLLSGADLLIAHLEDLQFAIEDKLNAEKKSADETNDSNEETGTKQIYLICEQNDLDAIVPLEDHLFAKGFEIIIPAFEGDPSQLRIDHQENLKSCDAVLIYYGSGNDLWLRSKTRDLLKISGYGRQKPLNVKYVCIAGPTNPQKERFRSHEVKIINFTNGDLNVFNDFITELK
jgi:hypothetical protein